MPYGYPEAKYYHTWYPHKYSSSFFFPFFSAKFCNPHYMNFIHICLLKRTNFSSLRVTWFLSYRPYDTDPLLFYKFNYDDSPHMKCWLFGSSQHWVLHVFIERSIFVSPIWGSLFIFKFSRKGNITGIFVSSADTIRLTWKMCFSSSNWHISFQTLHIPYNIASFCF